ncbi:MAG: hypothetical protein KGO81_13420 [Bacteroidota bacterium]|nr:hypothetical protein [Bacteroidota bacterium]
MGTFVKGILGGFSGTVGTVIGGSWKGIDYMRSQPARKTGTVTQAQLEQQMKFGMMVKFLQSMSGLLSVSFRNYAIKMTGPNNALSYNLKNAITGTYPLYTIDYSLVLVSRGDMPNATNPAAVAGTAGKVNFSWVNNAGTGKAKNTDKALLAVYCEDFNQAIYTTGSASRSAGAEILDVTPFSGKEVQVYIGFISEDNREVATSTYLGQVTVA